MKVLSLFDGIGCGRVALDKLGVDVDYYSSEIDKHAINVVENNYPSATHLGDIHSVSGFNVDLVMGGSPCQSISNLGDRSGLDGKSGLFYEFFRVLNECRKHNPNVKFLLENVRGNKKAIQTISEELGVQPTVINSNLFSAQNRNRLYWTNIDIPTLPVENNTRLKDILEYGVPKESILSPGRLRWLLSDKGQATVEKRYASIDPEKAQCVTARSDASWNSNYVTRDGQITRLTPIEYERLQTLPDNYTNCISNSQRYKAIGNGWTVDVISHILGGLWSK